MLILYNAPTIPVTSKHRNSHCCHQKITLYIVSTVFLIVQSENGTCSQYVVTYVVSAHYTHRLRDFKTTKSQCYHHTLILYIITAIPVTSQHPNIHSLHHISTLRIVTNVTVTL